MSRILFVMLMAAAGFGLGLAYGRLVSPVQYVDTDPPSLRVDFRSDYVLMVAESYAADHDAPKALRRLALLGPQSPDRLCAEAVQFARSVPYPHDDLELLQQLLRAVQQQTLMLTPAENPP
jgi:hypothetical protein